jgi:hypothetical protein
MNNKKNYNVLHICHQVGLKKGLSWVEKGTKLG